MIFKPTDVDGVWIVEPEPIRDERGFFARTWCREAFAERGLEDALVQCSVSFNKRRGTLRGLHYQAEPFAEAKLVRCTRGAIFDVAADLRPDSPTHLAWAGAELTAENRRMMYIAPGCAHGFQTLADDTEVFYQMSRPHRPEAARGVRFDDPRLRIEWPIDPRHATVSERDRALAFVEA